MARGYYLALTFGTLLSSQGADAQRLDPRGLRRWRLVSNPTPRPDVPSRGSSGWPLGPARRIENHTRLPGGVHKGSRQPAERGSEAEEGLDPEGQAGAPGDLPDGEQHARHEGRAVV